jgi:hypothetical protein
VNCELAGRLIDDFMQDELNQRDRSQMEEHLARCPRCASELRKYPALEREVRRALAASVRPLYLSADVSSKIVQASEESLSRAGRAQRAMLTVRIASGALAVLLVAVALLALLGRIPVPSNLKPVSLLPAKRLLPAEPELAAVFDEDQPIPRMATPTLSQVDASLLIEPRNLHPGEPFTMTVYVQSALPEPMETAHLDLDISGPSGFFRFELSFDGPLPAEGMSIFRVTPDLLAQPCEERYLMSPTDIFGVPGAYTIRVTILNPVTVAH